MFRVVCSCVCVRLFCVVVVVGAVSSSVFQFRYQRHYHLVKVALGLLIFSRVLKPNWETNTFNHMNTVGWNFRLSICVVAVGGLVDGGDIIFSMCSRSTPDVFIFYLNFDFTCPQQIVKRELR